MTGAETTIVHLHVKESPCQIFCPSVKCDRRKNIFLTIVKTVMLKLSPICQRFDEKSCNTRVQCCHFGSVSAAKKACRPQKHCLSVARATLAPDFRFLKNSLLRPREKFTKQIWRPRRKQCSNNRNNLTSQKQFCPKICLSVK